MEGYFIEAKYGWVCVHFNNENKYMYTQKTIDKSFFFFFLNIMQKYQRKKKFTEYGQKHTTHQFILRLIQYNFDN